MKAKKLITMLTSLIMMVSCTQGAFAERIKFTEPEISNAEDVTTVTYTLTEMPAGEGATLIAAYIDKESGNILSINSVTSEDVSLLDDGKIILTLEDKSAEGGELKHYLWPQLSSVISLKDKGPTAVTNLTGAADSAKPHSTVGLSWDGSIDDWDDSENISYNIYDTGMLLDTVSNGETSAKISGLPWGGTASIEIEAVDASGNKSNKRAKIDVATQRTHTIVTEGGEPLSLGTEITYNMKLLTPADYVDAGAPTYYHYKNDVVGGLPCANTDIRSNISTFHSFKFSNEFLNDIKDDRVFAVEIVFYDSGMDAFAFDPYYANSTTPAIKVLGATKSGKWETLRTTIEFTDTFIPEGKSNHNYSHIRFCAAPNKAMAAIRKFTFMPVDDYNAIEGTRDASIDVQQAIIYNGLDITAEPTPEKIEEKWGIKQDTLTISVDNTASYMGATAIEVMYLAPEGINELTINSETIPVTENGKWKKARIELDGTQDASAITIGGGVYVNNVRVVNALPSL